MGKTASGAMWLNKYDFSTRYYSASPVISYLYIYHGITLFLTDHSTNIVLLTMLFFLAGICFQSLITGNSGVTLLTRMLFGTCTQQYILVETAIVNLWIYYCLFIQYDMDYFICSIV